MSASALTSASVALVLLAHGSKSANWTAPFEALAARVQNHWSGPLCLAYFEHASPLLETVVIDLYQQGCRQIHIEPLLLAPGFHVETDLPARMQVLQQQCPGLLWHAGAVLIESERVQQAIVENCLQALRGR